MGETAIQLEPFVDLSTAAEFLSIRPRQLLQLARANILPGHPIGIHRNDGTFSRDARAMALARRGDSISDCRRVARKDGHGGRILS